MLFNTSIIPIDTISNSCLQQKNVSLSVLRLDKIHPVISGNKLFKLHYFLDEAIKLSLPIITFGGTHSNHLVATAYACKTSGLKSIGFVRGEKPAKLSNTLIASIDYGMQLHFISRENYKKKEENYFLDRLNNEEMRYLVVPEGGYHPKGSAGAALITQHISKDTTHICTALGTATTLAGLLIGAEKNQRVIGVPVLKGMNDVTERVNYLAGNHYSFQLLEGYHFGGYAKKTAQLINFMNQLYGEFNLSTDFVYTAKMMFAVLDSIEKGFFATGSKITCVHTGGLQGNLSLPPGALIF